MSKSPTVAENEERALATSLAYRFLSAAYRYPDEANLEAIRALHRGVAEALPLLVARKEKEHGGILAEPFAEVTRLLEEWTREEMEDQYVSLFGHAVHGPCPPYEAEYGEKGEGLQHPHEIADIVAFYRAFELDLAQGIGERPDCVSLECEFLAFLCLKLAHARSVGDGELARISFEARGKFLREHLGRWMPTFAGLLLKEAEQGFYPAVTRWAGAVLSADAARLGVPLGPEKLRLRLPSEAAPEDCTTCGMSEPCAIGFEERA
ncbi:MAG: molecular chaperone [Planctomycetota bacterium]